jgi:hypothetical protein
MTHCPKCHTPWSGHWPKCPGCGVDINELGDAENKLDDLRISCGACPLPKLLPDDVVYINNNATGVHRNITKEYRQATEGKQ